MFPFESKKPGLRADLPKNQLLSYFPLRPHYKKEMVKGIGIYSVVIGVFAGVA